MMTLLIDVCWMLFNHLLFSCLTNPLFSHHLLLIIFTVTQYQSYLFVSGLMFLCTCFSNGPAETVIYRIFYYINRSGTGHLTLRELKRGNIIDAMQHADEEEDINKVLR
jgi:hypothetical protein